ncbi:hypothetical protein RFI_33786 [Reticulomyxa filosa]|uniref:Caspase family p20 domain-containing protein n=1 Tax=Reticulomyxa filosa TaxID=46433 RepID=X6LQE0_RETFI|nr:hypothetical protein RFI_33786 [Reticulomyxa filosa]|eukprot:ETO03616.1 hypothetical protein RFI_33786 [Reticulomyxa filosa]
MLTNLFEKVYVCIPHATESLTLLQLNTFLTKHCAQLDETNNVNNYDYLIFIWCGYGSTTIKGDILITSDQDDACKYFNDVVDIFANQTGAFADKPYDIYQKYVSNNRER